MSPKKKVQKKKPVRKSAAAATHAPVATNKRVGLGIGLLILFLLGAGIPVLMVSSKKGDHGRRFDPPTVALAELEPIVREAIQKAYDYLDQNPFSHEAWGGLGQHLFAYGFKSEAGVCFERAHQYGLDVAKWAYFAALCFYPDRIDQAVSHMEKAVAQFDPTEVEPRIRLGTILADQGEFERAEFHLVKALEIRPDDPVAMLGLARVLQNTGRFDEALVLLERIKGHRLTAKAAHQMLSSLYFRSGRAEDAEKASYMAETLPDDQTRPDALIESLAQFRKGRKAWLNHAENLIRSGRFDEASVVVDKLIKDYPNEEGAWLFQGRLLMARKDYAAAERAFRRELENVPDTVEARVQLAVTLIYQGLPKESILVLEEAIRIQPDLAEAYFNLGLCHMQLNDYEKATQAYSEAVHYKPNMVDSYIGLANAQANLARYSEAAKILERARSVKPDDPRIQGLLTQIQKATGGVY